MEPIEKRIAEDVKTNKIVLFAKGDKGAPMCGFSAAVMEMFDSLGAPYEVRNVLADPELREGIKKFTNWPTIPQIFILGQFIGGCDITRDLYESGELKKMVANAYSNQVMPN